MQFSPDKDGFVDFGEVCRDILGMQCQYGSQYVNLPYTTMTERKPYLGEGLSIKGDPNNYHFLQIHADSVREFVTRVVTHKKTNYIWSTEAADTAMAKLSAAGF